MNKENYISLRAEDVHKRLITDIGLNMDEAPALLEELTAADRYKEDHVFRASIETSNVVILLKLPAYLKNGNCFHLTITLWLILTFY